MDCTRLPRLAIVLVGCVALCLAISDLARSAEPTGEELCFEQGKWEQGLPLLVKSRELAIVELGNLETKPPTTSERRAALADAWVAAAKVAPEKHRLAMYARAIHWYRLAAVDAQGPARTKIARAIDTLTFEMIADEAHPVWKTPAKYEGRFSPLREKLWEQYGGGDAAETAIEAALKWIALHQSGNGSWQFDLPTGPSRENVGDSAQIHGATGLALLPLLAAGHTHRHGEYRDNVARGLKFLIAEQQWNKQLGTAHWDQRSMLRGHAWATIALCEAYALTGDDKLRPAAEGAVQYIVESQSQADGGWPLLRGPSSLPAVAWQVEALAAAQGAGLKVPSKTWERAQDFLDLVSRGNEFTSFPRGSAEMEATVIGWHAWGMLPGSEPATLNSGVRQVLRIAPRYDRSATTTYRRLEAVRHSSFAANQQVAAQGLVAAQSTTGDERGSWYFNHKLDKSDGRLYDTVFATLALQAAYRHTQLGGR
jgi:hypothetical protein